MEKIVWAKSVPPYPWWPAKIMDQSESDSKVEIEFFGDKFRKQVCRKMLKPYPEFREKLSKASKKSSNSTQLLLNQAIEEADKELGILGVNFLETSKNRREETTLNDEAENTGSGEVASFSQRTRTKSYIRRQRLVANSSENLIETQKELSRCDNPFNRQTQSIDVVPKKKAKAETPTSSHRTKASSASKLLTKSSFTSIKTKSRKHPVLSLTPKAILPVSTNFSQLGPFHSKKLAFTSPATAKSISELKDITMTTVLPNPQESLNSDPPKPFIHEKLKDVPVPMPTSSVEDDEDEDLPSYEFMLQGVALNFKPGEVVWVKWRKCPHWPCLITKNNDIKKRVAVRFINCENPRNGLLVNPTSIGDYPGDNYKEYVKNSQSYPLYKDSLSKAIDMADRYLYRKADNQEIEAFSYFFPKDVEQEISDIELYSADSECIKSLSSERLDCEAVMKDESPPKNVVFKEFSKSTLKSIEERNVWLRALLTVIKEDQLTKQLKEYMHQGETLTKVTDKNLHLGPFVFAYEHLRSELLKHVLSVYNQVTHCIHMPEWCYTSALPQIIIGAMVKVDNISPSEAKQKFFINLLTEEEDIRLDEQLCAASAAATPLDDT